MAEEELHICPKCGAQVRGLRIMKHRQSRRCIDATCKLLLGEMLSTIRKIESMGGPTARDLAKAALQRARDLGELEDGTPRDEDGWMSLSDDAKGLYGLFRAENTRLRARIVDLEDGAE